MPRRHVQRQTDARRHALEKPDVLHRHGQFDVAHAFAAQRARASPRRRNGRRRCRDADALVFSAGAFPVLDRAGKMRSQNKPPFSGLNVR